MATLLEITHDSSTTLSDFYDTINNSDSALSIITGAALNGSTNGVQMDFDAGTSNLNRLQDANFHTVQVSSISWQFRIDLGGVINSNAGFVIAQIFVQRLGSANFLQVDVTANAGDSGFVAEVFYQDSVSGFTGLGTVVFPSSGDTLVKVTSTRETADGNNDGEIRLFIDGAQESVKTTAENFDRFDPNYTYGAIFRSSDANVAGTLKYDEILVTDVVAFSGYSLILGGGQL